MTNNVYNASLQNFPVKKWIWLNFSGWFAGAFLVIFFSSILHSVGIENMQFCLSIAIGLGMGISQSIVLVKYGISPARWVLTTVIGFAIPFITGDLLRYFDIIHLESLYIPACVGTGSILAAIFQRNTHKFAHNTLWIVISFIAWSTAGLIVYAVEFTKYITQTNLVAFFINLAAIVSGGLIIGVITGFYLKRQLNPPSHE